MEELIVELQGKLRNVLGKCPGASDAAVEDFVKFFQDVRPEPSE